MKMTIRRLLALLLAVATLAALPAAAEADGETRYPADQYFVKDESQTWGYAVQVSSSTNYSGSCKNRDKMLALGYDSFVYDIDGQYRVMCGKFRDADQANHYKEVICANTERKKAYVTNVCLPSWAYTAFEDLFRSDPNNNSGGDYIPWEEPTGPFYDGDRAATTRTVYSVQFSSGTSFHGSEQHRDEMIAQGFDAFVYKKDGKYRTLSGMFQNKQDAQARCDAIKKYTDQSDAYVTTVDIPTSYIDYSPTKDQSAYYGYYRDLLVNCNWTTYCMPQADVDSFRRSASSATQYLYYVCDLDKNGVDDLIVVETFGAGYGAVAVFSCDRNGAYLMTWSGAYGDPVVSACQDKGILAVQKYYNRVAACDLHYFRSGRWYDSKEARVNSNYYVEVPPTDADPNADGYYVVLTGYRITDLKRLGGDGSKTAPNPAPNPSTPNPAPNPAPNPSSGGYTHDSVLEAARAAAAGNSKYSTVSDKNVELEVPPTAQFLSTPFTMEVYAKKNGKAIYFMPKPQPGNGNLGKIKQGEVVTILAETNDFYFFVASDGRAGWNGKSYFR